MSTLQHYITWLKKPMSQNPCLFLTHCCQSSGYMSNSTSEYKACRALVSSINRDLITVSELYGPLHMIIHGRCLGRLIVHVCCSVPIFRFGWTVVHFLWNLYLWLVLVIRQWDVYVERAPRNPRALIQESNDYLSLCRYNILTVPVCCTRANSNSTDVVCVLSSR